MKLSLAAGWGKFMDLKEAVAGDLGGELGEDRVEERSDGTSLPSEPAVTREQRRSRRKRDVRARTISVKRMTKRELELGRML